MSLGVEGEGKRDLLPPSPLPPCGADKSLSARLLGMYCLFFSDVFGRRLTVCEKSFLGCRRMERSFDKRLAIANGGFPVCEARGAWNARRFAKGTLRSITYIVPAGTKLFFSFFAEAPCSEKPAFVEMSTGFPVCTGRSVAQS